MYRDSWYRDSQNYLLTEATSVLYLPKYSPTVPPRYLIASLCILYYLPKRTVLLNGRSVTAKILDVSGTETSWGGGFSFAVDATTAEDGI